MVAFGGNGAVHGATLAAHAGISDIIIPPASGVFSALGLLFARIQHRLVSVYWRDVEKIDYPQLNARVQDLYRQAAEMMAAEGLTMERCELRLALDMRYAGQSSELGIPVSQSKLLPEILAEVVEQFHLEHERSYGYSSRTERVQLVNLRLRARGMDRQDHLPSPTALRTGGSKTAATERQVFFGPERGWVKAPILRRGDLTAKVLAGPLIVEEYDTTIVVPPDGEIHTSADIVRIRLNGIDHAQ